MHTLYNLFIFCLGLHVDFPKKGYDFAAVYRTRRRVSDSLLFGQMAAHLLGVRFFVALHEHVLTLESGQFVGQQIVRIFLGVSSVVVHLKFSRVTRVVGLSNKNKNNLRPRVTLDPDTALSNKRSQKVTR